MNKMVSPMRQKINAMESFIKDHPLAGQVDIKIEHIFSDGIYARKAYIPKDTIVVGKLHKYQNLNIMTKGKMEIVVGEETRVIEAPFEIVSPPNTKRMAKALEDTIWITILRTDEINLDQIEAHFTANSEEEWIAFLREQEQFKLPI